MAIIWFMALPMVQLWLLYHDGRWSGTGFFLAGPGRDNLEQ